MASKPASTSEPAAASTIGKTAAGVSSTVEGGLGATSSSTEARCGTVVGEGDRGGGGTGIGIEATVGLD
eukprot:4255073-Amphidinium_carterae.5